MMGSMLNCDHPSRPIRNARKYSMTWKTSMARFGSFTSATSPRTMREPFSTRTIPPSAITGLVSEKTLAMMRSSASFSRTESASTMHT